MVCSTINDKEVELNFGEVSFDNASKLAGIYALRDNQTCDSTVLDTYIWKDYYNTKIHMDEKRALLLMKNEEEYFSAMPYCREEDLQENFKTLEKYFNEVLKKPLKIYLADESAVNSLNLLNDPDYIVKEENNLKDYLYSAEELRTLAGKKFQKKRNLVNKFNKEYEGRWKYVTMCCSDVYYLEEFMDRWVKKRLEENVDSEETLLQEKEGIVDILMHCDKITYRVGGIFIDDRLEAFAIGSYNPYNKMIVVSIEKGNSEIPGIYQVINQQFLLNSYEDAVTVNREDDMGLEGLRHAKESYNPIGFARKYMVLQKWGDEYMSEIEDYYESASEVTG